MDFEYVRCRKSVGRDAFSKKCYKNTRTKKEVVLTDGLFFGMWCGTRKAVKKTCRWHVFRPWESPSKSRCIRYGCRWILNTSDAEKVLVRTHFRKSAIRTRTPKKRSSLRTASFGHVGGSRADQIQLNIKPHPPHFSVSQRASG